MNMSESQDGDKQSKVRDMRQPGHFWADNEIVDDHLPVIGVHGFAVYMLLCRYANNRSAKCDPSISTMARQLGISKPTVKEALKKLVKASLITMIQRAGSKPGEINQTNEYTLLTVKGVGSQVAQVGNTVAQDDAPSGVGDGKAGCPGVGNQVAPNNTKKNKTQEEEKKESSIRIEDSCAAPADAGLRDAALNAIQEQLVNVEQTQTGESASPSSKADTPPTPEPPVPALPKTTALPDVPEGYEAVYTGYFRHFIRLGKSKTICGNTRLHSFTIEQALKMPSFPWNKENVTDYFAHVKDCPKCAVSIAKAAARAPQAKAKKPAIYSDDSLFEAIAAFCFKVADKADFKAIGGRVAKIRLALCDYVIEKLGKEPTPEQTAKVVERVKALPYWYDRACKKCDRPQSPDTFMTWYIKYLQSLNGTAQAEGDSIWFDGEQGRYLKREKGILYTQDPMNGEKWIPVL